MRSNKIAIIWTSIISLVSLIASVVLHLCTCEYISNIFIGIFASGILALMIAIINYRVERRRILEKIYFQGIKACNNFYQFDSNGEIDVLIDTVLDINKFDYSEFDAAYGEIDLMFDIRNKKREYIFSNIYDPIMNVKHEISKICIHFREYKKSTNGNVEMMRLYLDKLKNDINIINVADKVIDELDGKYFEIMYPHEKKKRSKTHAD